MPSIYSTVFQNFLRSGITKSLTYGYAQSFVAATHPHALNAQNRPSFGRRHTSHANRLTSLNLQSAFHSAAASAAASSASTTVQHLPSVLEARHEWALGHGGLDAYFEHLVEKSQQAAEASGPAQNEHEWIQYQFPKRIEWKPNPASVLVSVKPHKPEPIPEEIDAPDAAVAEHVEARGIPPGDKAALAHIDAALEMEIEARRKTEGLEEQAAASSHLEGVRTRPTTPLSGPRTPASIARSATPPLDAQSQAYSNHLARLSKAGRYAEIPAVFEAMLVGGIRPTPVAYNALLLSAMHLPNGKYEVVSKALDIYADMLRRKVWPDSDTFNILVGLLASRSLEVAQLKRGLEEKRARFGGMEEPGKFMFQSHELEAAILSEDDRLDLALQLFRSSVASNKALYSSEAYHQLISACAQAGRVSDMLALFERMELQRAVPYAATFPAMITAFATAGDLASAVECYNEYRSLAIAHDKGEPSLCDRADAQVYAAVINAYIVADDVGGAMRFYQRIIEEYDATAAEIKDAIIAGGFVKGFVTRGIYEDALNWAQAVEDATRGPVMSEVATVAADNGDRHTAVSAFANVHTYQDATTPAMALLAMSVREGDVAAASRYWQVLSSPEADVSSTFIEPAAMYAVAMIGSGQTAEGLTQAEAMFLRISSAAPDDQHLADEIEEGAEFISRFMAARGVTDPREAVSQSSYPPSTLPASSFPSTPTVSSSCEDTYDPYARNTDLKGSSIISDELEGAHGRKGPRLQEALTRFRNMRRIGRHPRYITYAKLITAAARDGKMDLCQDILGTARTDVPPLPQYAVVRYGWSSILDAMVGACLNLNNRALAEQYHQELLAMGATPSANTYGLYITTLKESTKTFDEASEALKIFHRAKAEGVEPSSFLYNALIGKLGKARRIDDCLFYFNEMRSLAIKPTSVTYGTIVNALCRVSDGKFAEDLFNEMESMPNYKARPAPYNSMMQFFLTTKRDKTKVVAYYDRMRARAIAPTAHTFKLLVDTHATLEPIDMDAAEAVLKDIRAAGMKPEAVHYAALIHARGCVLHDMEGARRVFNEVMQRREGDVATNPCLFQALFEAMVANHHVADTDSILALMRRKGVEMTPYIANTLIHGWAAEGQLKRAREIYNTVGRERREPSTYEAMTRAYLAALDRESARGVVTEMLNRGYPSAVVNKVLELLGGGLNGSSSGGVEPFEPENEEHPQAVALMV